MTNSVLKFGRSWRSLIPNLLFALVLLIIGLYVTAYFEHSVLLVPLDIGESEYSLRLPVFLLIVIVVLVRPIISLFDSRYEVSDHHLRIFKGLLSFWSKNQEFAFEDLMGVQVTQNFFERFFGVGNIQVGSRSNLINLKLNGVRSPEYYAKEISRHIDNARIAEKHSS
jgi:uncharacterized membrane protein YdbT with pleckstrin-like domain